MDIASFKEIQFFKTISPEGRLSNLYSKKPYKHGTASQWQAGQEMRLSFNLSNVPIQPGDGGSSDTEEMHWRSTEHDQYEKSVSYLHSTDTKNKPLSSFKGEGYELSSTSRNTYKIRVQSVIWE